MTKFVGVLGHQVTTIRTGAAMAGSSILLLLLLTQITLYTRQPVDWIPSGKFTFLPSCLSFFFFRPTILQSSSSMESPQETQKHQANTGAMSDSTNESNRMRILYIVTSSTDEMERFDQIVLPVLQESLESLTTEYLVDLYLVLGYTMSKQKQVDLSRKLPKGVGLEIWNDATPVDYTCKRPHHEESSKDTNKCISADEIRRTKASGRHPKEDTSPERAMLTEGGAQLARQHRYVVKDKFPYYDFFMAFEDDMLVTKGHVQHHLQVMRELEVLKSQASDDHDRMNDQKFWGQLSKRQLEQMRPGFIRVEVLPNGSRGRAAKSNNHGIAADLNFPILDGAVPEGRQNSSNVPSYYQGTIDPRPCCHSSRIGTNRKPTSREVLLWEAGIRGMAMREMPFSSSLPSSSYLSSWIAMLPGPERRIPGYTLDQHIKIEQGHPNGHVVNMDFISDPQLLAQSAGWMASQEEILFLNERCVGGFLPPFSEPEFPRDGFWKRTVEYWSGGIQLWCRGCRMQRIISLRDPESFSKHLIYHTANNKQEVINKRRLVLADDFLGQLNALKKSAMAEMKRRLET